MKPIQILVLAAATAAAALAQNTSATPQTSGSSAQPGATAKTTQKSAAGAPSTKAKSSGTASQTSGSTSQTPAVKLIVPKAGMRTAASSAKSTATAASGQNSAAHGPTMPAAHPAGKPAVSQKTPVLTVKPVQKPGKNAPKVAEKKAPEKTPHPREESPVAIVPQKTAPGNKTAPGVEDSTLSANGRRDPFISVIRTLPSGPGGPTCSVGKRCLFIPDLELKGIAKDTDGQMMAVVVSNTHRAYFLRENDQVFNGSVQKITSDSVIFREFATDRLGRETAHEVVKKLART